MKYGYGKVDHRKNETITQEEENLGTKIEDKCNKNEQKQFSKKEL